MELHTRLSDLTPPVVDTIYNIQGPIPQAAPVFVFLVGAPGSGKSSGHNIAIEAGLLTAGNYATINIDLLLESLLPFRAASAIANFVKGSRDNKDKDKETIRFSTISAYASRKENLGLFKWFDRVPEEYVSRFSNIRDTFRPLTDIAAPHTLNELNDAALQRAIDRRIPIVYETTLYLSKEGRVSKVDALMRYLKSTPYRIVFYHIRGEPTEIALRLQERQIATAKADYPYVRTVPTSIEAVTEMIRQNQDAFAVLRKKYKKQAHFEDAENPFALSPSSPRRGRRSHRGRSRSNRILRVYGSPDTNLYVSPTSSEERQRNHRSTIRNK